MLYNVENSDNDRFWIIVFSDFKSGFKLGVVGFFCNFRIGEVRVEGLRFLGSLSYLVSRGKWLWWCWRVWVINEDRNKLFFKYVGKIE